MFSKREIQAATTRAITLPRLALALLLAFFASIFAVEAAEMGNVIHVSPNGSVANTLSLQDARTEVQHLIANHESKITVLLESGNYFFETSFKLDATVSPPKGGFVNWAAAPGAHVRFIGARRVTNLVPFKKISNIASRPEPKDEDLKVVSLPSIGVPHWSKLQSSGFGLPTRTRPSEIFYNGKPLTLARTPQAGWLTLDDAPAGQFGNLVKVSGLDLAQISAEIAKGGDLWLYGYWDNNWADQFVRIKSVDLVSKVLTLDTPLSLYGMKQGQRLMLVNSLSALDSPGEYQIDQNGMLYLWPPKSAVVAPTPKPASLLGLTFPALIPVNQPTPSPSPIAKEDILISLTDVPLVLLDHVSRNHFSGIEMGYTLDSAMKIIEGEDDLVTSCLIRNTGNEGINISKGTGHQLIGNRFVDVGNEGVTMDGGDRITLTPSHFVVKDNEFLRYARIGRTNHPAVYTSGVGSLITHNEISQAPHMAIRFAGNDHIIEYNHIHHVVLETSDAGAVYIGRDWSMRGNIVRYNYIHHLGDHNLPDPGAVGIYLDDLASGTEVVGNIVYRARRGVLLGGGRDNIIHKNIFAEGHVSVMMDRRGKEWKVDFLHGKNLDFVGRLLDVHYDSPLYQSRYPRLVNILNNDPLEPLGNEIEDNIFLNAPLSLNGAKPLEKNNTNLDLGKPGTPDDQDDASDNSDSPADLIQIAKWAVVQGIPFNKIGLSGGPERKTLLETFGK